MKIKLLELFGGIGAPRKALENIGIDVKSIDYVEILTNAVKAYNAMYDNDYKEQNVLDWNIDVDLLVHGSPCQDFSSAGRNDLSSGRSILYNRTLEIIENELKPRPKFVVWENVVGLLSKKHIEHFNHYLNKMEELGYKNYYEVLEALEFGIPQTRPRVFVVSIRNDINKTFDFNKLERKEARSLDEFLDLRLDELDIPSVIEFKQPSMWKALENNKVKIIVKNTATITTKQRRWNSAGVVFKDPNFYKQDFLGIPEPKSKYGYSLKECQEYFPSYFKNKKDLSEIFRYLTPRECWNLMGYNSEVNFRKFRNFFTTPRKTDGKLVNGQYNRVWNTKKYVGTIPSSVVLKIGFEKNGELYYRNLTPEECWLLQGFDNDVFSAVKAKGISDSSLYALAGNSICVPVLEAIFKELLIKEKGKRK